MDLHAIKEALRQDLAGLNETERKRVLTAMRELRNLASEHSALIELEAALNEGAKASGVEPTPDDLAEAQQNYPDTPPAEQYRLAQAIHLIRRAGFEPSYDRDSQ